VSAFVKRTFSQEPLGNVREHAWGGSPGVGGFFKTVRRRRLLRKLRKNRRLDQDEFTIPRLRATNQTHK
jgi:hypothetical protein